MTYQTDEPDVLDLYPAVVEFEKGVGLTLYVDGKVTWLSWDETQQLAKWLEGKMKE